MKQTFREKSKIEKVIIASTWLWVATIVIFCIAFTYVIIFRKETFDVAPGIFAIIIAVLILLGILFYFIATLTYTIHKIKTNATAKLNPVSFLIKLFFAYALFPLYSFVQVLRPMTLKERWKEYGIRGLFKPIYPKIILRKIASVVGILIFVLPVWVMAYFLIGIIGQQILGYTTQDVRISGTGSMAPTFPKGEGNDPKELANQIVSTTGMLPYPNGLVVRGKRLFGHTLERGDIVVVETEKIREMTKEIHGEPTGWVKRLIGLPGDTIEIRSGTLYLNGEPQKEKYTAHARSTFAESFLSECKQITVPENSIFVMGDNRKGSGDSREIGFIEMSGIKNVLPFEKQIGTLDSGWRNTDKDFDEESKIRIDKEKYLEMINEKRKEAGVKPLKYQPKLELSAKLRGDNILKYDDYSFEATKSGYTMAKAMRDANYSNITYGEAKHGGYFSEDELIENQFQFPDTKKFLTDKNYQEIGIAEVEGETNNCPTQVIVLHFAGYVPPNYKKEDTESWRTTSNHLKEIQPSWERLTSNEVFYANNKTDVDRINTLIAERIRITSLIASRMEANLWLSQSEKQLIERDKEVYEEIEKLADKLNGL